MNGTLRAFPAIGIVTIGYVEEQVLQLPDQIQARTIVTTLPPSASTWAQRARSPHDLVLVDLSDHPSYLITEVSKSSVRDGLWLIGHSGQFPPITGYMTDSRTFRVSTVTTAQPKRQCGSRSILRRRARPDV